MNSNGGTQRRFSKRELYTVIALLVMVFVTAGAMFAVPAWSQSRSEDSQKDKKASDQQKQTQSSSTRTENRASAKESVGIQAVDGDVDITKEDDPDPVEVNGLLLYTITVTNNDAANQPVIVVDDLPNSVDFIAADIDGGTAGGDCEDTSDNDAEVVCTVTLGGAGGSDDDATIQILVEPTEKGTIDNFAEVFDDDECDPDPLDCTDSDSFASVTIDTKVTGNNNNNNNNHHRINNRHVRDFLRHHPGLNQFRENSDLLNAEDDLNGENSTLESAQYSGEDTLGSNGSNSGVSATSDQYGAEASTPGAVASANGDEDTLAPVGPQGDVVDEVPTSGPLPDTGGAPVATGTVLALVLFGAGLLAVRLVMLWRGRRT